MTRNITHLSILLLASTTLLNLGCSDANRDNGPLPPAVEHGDHADQTANSAHNHEFGPNHGLVAVLGGHEFHVEVVADEDTGKVRAILTDPEFQAVKTDATSVSINMILGDKPQQFLLDYSDGTTPIEFQTTDMALAEAIHDGWQGEARVAIEISGSPRTGPLAKPEAGHAQHEGTTQE